MTFSPSAPVEPTTSKPLPFVDQTNAPRRSGVPEAVLPGLLAAALPLMACAMISRINGPTDVHAVGTIMSMFWTVLPFAILAFLRTRSEVERVQYCPGISAGLLTALLVWGWVTIDNVFFPGVTGIGISPGLWMSPTILCAMLASTRLNQAMAL